MAEPSVGGPSVDEPIRVLRVIARLNMGGPALHVAYLTEGLASRGYETTLVAGSLARGEESMQFVAEAHGVRVHAISELHREISLLRDVTATIRLAQLIRRERPQIVHTHTAKAGALGRVAAVLAGKPRPIVVHTFHGHVLRGYFGPLRTAAFRLVETLLARVSDVLIAVGPQVRDELVSLGVAPAEKFEVIRLGIALDERVADGAEARAEARRLLGVPADRFVVGWIGRITGIKRPHDVLLAFRKLRDRGVEASLCLVGDGPNRDAVERHASELGIARDCLYLGYQDDVSRWYALLDAFLLTSANEGTPVTAIEALAAGKPVVSTAVGGVPDVVIDGVDGFLAPAGDTDALAEALARLAGDPELRARMGEAGRGRVLEQYAVERLLDDVDRLYRRLLDR